MAVKLYTNVTAVTTEDLSADPGASAKVLQTDAGGSVTLDHIHVTNDAGVGGSAKVTGGVTAGSYTTPSTGDVRISGGLAAGIDADPGNGNLEYAGGLLPYRNSQTYAACAFVPLGAQLGSASWDGDSFSTTAKTKIDLSAAFGLPAGIKAVLINAAVRDSASAGGEYWLVLSPSDTAGEGLMIGCSGLANDKFTRGCLVVPCDSGGDIYYQITASGANTFDVYLYVWGYYI